MLIRRAEMISGGEWSSLKVRTAEEVGVESGTRPGGVLHEDFELSANRALTAEISCDSPT